MTTIQAGLTYYKQVNEKVREAAEKDDSITIENVIGQRYIGCGSTDRKITVHGTAGNGLGQYLNGSTIEVFGNAQEAVGDTMNAGEIVVHGNVGDACGYGMRGGRIFIRGNVGYRAGIHMKAYQDKIPVLIVGGLIVFAMGIFLAVYYLSFGIFYDGESFLMSRFGKKDAVHRYEEIVGQKLYVVQGGSVVAELYLKDGSTVSLQSTMDGVYPFLDTAFAGWCLQTGRDPESCDFHDPSKSLWFPPVEES